MCEIRIKYRCLSSFDFFKELFHLGQFNSMPEYTSFRIFKSIWLIVHLQDRKNILQRFYFAYLNYCPTIKGHSKLTCLKKKKKELQHSFHTPTRPWGSSTSFLWLFLEASVFFSRPATKDVLCCYWGLCVWLTLERFLESVITICMDLGELHLGYFCVLYVDLPIFNFNEIIPVCFKITLIGHIQIPSEVPCKFLSLKKKFKLFFQCTVLKPIDLVKEFIVSS